MFQDAICVRKKSLDEGVHIKGLILSTWISSVNGACQPALSFFLRISSVFLVWELLFISFSIRFTELITVV